MKIFNKKNKYGAKKITIDGHRFDSIMESDYYLLLKHQEKLGLIEILELQPKVYLTKARILMKPDFLILHLDTGEVIWHEVKGAETSLYKLKKRLWKHYGRGLLRVIKKKGRHFQIFEEISRSH